LLRLNFENEFLEAFMRSVPVKSVAIAKAITYDNNYFRDPAIFQAESNSETGRFLLNLPIAVGVAGSVWAIIFNHMV
jgi:hypothetical protein